MAVSQKTRLDQLLVERHGYSNRSRARDTIMRGCVTVDSVVAKKPGMFVQPDAAISITDDAAKYVSRAALKLKHALQETGFDPDGLTALDLGASTGGFTQVLLEKGARHVFCVDAGSGQLHPLLATDKRVTNIENMNARNLELGDLDGTRPQFLVCDLSFISLNLALPPALDIAEEGCLGIFLIKPQFEVGKSNIGSGGIVRDTKLARDTAQNVAEWLDNNPDWQVTHFLQSPIKGGDGNIEFLMAAVKQGGLRFEGNNTT